MKTKRTMKYELYISNGTTAGTDIPASCVDNGWLDVSSLINSKDTKIEYNVCNESFKSMADSASIVLRYADSKFFSAVAKLLIDNGNTDILLRINGTTWIYSKETTDTVEIGGASVDGEVVTVNDATILDFGAEATGNRMVIPSGKASISGNTAIISNDMISVNNHLMDIESATLVLNDGALDYTEAVSSHKTECYFLGYIPNGMTSYSTAFLPQNITLSAKSLEEKLADINYTSNVSLVGEKASVIANMMLSFAGSKLKTYKDANNVHYNVYDMMANYFYLAETTLYATVRYFAMTSDDKKTVKTIIDDIIFECGGNPGIGGSDDGFGWALDFDHKTGMFAIKKTTGYLSESYINALKQNSAKRVHYSTKNQLKLSRSTNKKDGIAIKYYSAKTLLNNVVYVENIDNSIAENKDSTGRDEDGLKAGVWKGVTVYTDSEVEQSGGTTGTDSLAGKNYYPNDSDINATYQEYKKELLDKAYQEGKNRLQSDNIDLVFVYENSTTLEVNASDMNGNPLSINGWTDIPASKWYEKAKVTRPQGRMISYPKKSWVVLHNKNNARVNLQSMSILGDVVYKDTEHQIVMPLMAENPEEVTLKYAVKSTRTETGKIYRYDGKERAKTETTIADDIAAGDFSKWYYNSVVKGKDKVTWTDVGEGYSHDVGDYVYAQFEGIGGSDNIGRGIACIIVQKHLTMGEVVKCEYTALSVSDFVQNPDAYEIVKKRQIQAVKPSSYQQAIENGTFTGSEIEWVESLAKDVVDNSPAPSVDFSQSSLTFIRNNRSRDYDKFDTATYNAYSFGINVSGIDASKYSIIGWTFNGITPDEQASSEGYYFEQEKSISIRVKLKGMSDKITVFVWYKILGVTYSHEYVMEVDDKTTDATYFGRMDALPDSTENYKYIDNDMLVLKGEDDSREAYIFSGGSWRRYEESDTNYNVALDAVKDVLGGNNHVEANGFDWFGKLMANTVVANEMFAKGLESPDFKKNSDGSYTGFKLKDNMIYAGGAEFTGIKIDKNSTFNGTVDVNNVLKVKPSSSENRTYKFGVTGYDSQINMNDVFNGVTDDIETTVSNSKYYGNTVSKILNVTSKVDTSLSSGSTTKSFSGYAPDVRYVLYTALENCSIKITAKITGTSQKAWFTIGVPNGDKPSNGNKSVSTQSSRDVTNEDYSMQEGESLYIEFYNRYTTQETNCTVEISWNAHVDRYPGYTDGVDSTGLWLFYNNKYNKVGSGWQSCNVNDIIRGVSYRRHVSDASGLQVSIEGGSYIPYTESFYYEDCSISSIRLNGNAYSASNSNCRYDGTKFTVGGYEIEIGGHYLDDTSFQFGISATTEKIYISSIYPFKTDEHTIGLGTNLRYKAGYFKDIYFETPHEQSKREFKENIKKSLIKAIDIINGTEIVEYNYKKGDPVKEHHIGFIADDTDSILSGYDHDSMMLGDCIGVLLKAVQELYILVTNGTLKAENDDSLEYYYGYLRSTDYIDNKILESSILGDNVSQTIEKYRSTLLLRKQARERIAELTNAKEADNG